MAKLSLKNILPGPIKSWIKLIPKTLLCSMFFLLSKLPLGSLFRNAGVWALERKFFRVAEFIAVVLCKQQRMQGGGASPDFSCFGSIDVGQIRLSVIIPTYNRADMLPGLFESLCLQTLSNDYFEIIVVNNNCSDETDSICDNYRRRFRFFRVVHERDQSLSAARHAGWRAARAEILVFCDDDIEAFPSWLATIDAAFSTNVRLGLVSGNNIGKFTSPLPIWFDKLWSQETSGIKINVYYSLLEGVETPTFIANPQLVFGCNYSIRRKALEELEGFEPDCMPNVLFQGGGETGPSLRLKDNWLFLLHPGASVYHRMPNSRLTLEYLSKRSVFFAATQLYDAFRNGILPPKYLFEDNLLCKLDIDLRASVEQLRISYITALLNFSDFRMWVTRRTYFDHEMPSQGLILWANKTLSNVSWHAPVEILQR